ncbi:hypothetical protein ACSHT2_13950 [Bradyrhizobium sp. PUT101]|uniref:hypothetical protein n=1 Tax=Bradyrhizobium sp. PUT101 TaxID=3447427 RepID=UPI003F838DD5
MLITSVTPDEGSAMDFLIKLLGLVEKMASGLGVTRKWRLSELLRDAADRLEAASGEREWHFD